MRHNPSPALVFMLAILPLHLSTAQTTYTSEKHTFTLVTIQEKLDQPWGFTFLPDGSILVTEKKGTVLRVQQGKTERITGTPAVSPVGQGGLLDIALDPDFARNGLLYLSHSVSGQGGHGTAVTRAKLEGSTLTGLKRIWEMTKKTAAGQHFGSRLAFLRDGTLLITAGDRGDMNRAQDLADAAGKTHRINTDGSIPLDNPFLSVPAALPSVYSYGHRNPQGLAVHPETGAVFATEHGPQGGDEVNLILPGKNYGWPVVTRGRQYGTGAKIGESESKPGMEDPLVVWTPSIAPSGLAWYVGSAFPSWRGDLFSGNLAGTRLVRITLRENRLVSSETLLSGVIGRIRDVRTGPDGFIYLLTDGTNARLYRLEMR